ncbi:hypothetical protein AACH06_08280 [Ideonella sp. DXS29W]|uniref:Protein activator of alkane oxidation PraB n=1 Tax=Ideonella lacteola TaxID=2984193 RepID=A0ABU9BLG6_9BURK
MLNHPLVRALVLGAMAASGSAWAVGPQKGLVPGFLDAKTGSFIAATQPAVATGVESPLATLGGTLALRFNITLKSSVPSDWKIQCSQVATAIDSGGLTFQNSKTVLATRSGSTATCQVNINYSWSLNGAGGFIHTNWTVMTLDSTLTNTLVDVLATGSMPSIEIPANGTVTSRTVSVTL